MKNGIIVLLCVFMVTTGLNAEELTGNRKVDLGNIIIVPNRIGEFESELPANVSVLDREAIAESNAENIPDLLRGELGINVSDYSGTRKSVLVDIRGFGETASTNVLVLVDGRRVNPMDIAGADWLQIPIETIERVEVLRGAASVLYGDNAVGGVINIVTKKGSSEFKATSGATYGSYDFLSEHAHVSGGVDNFTYSVTSTHGKNHGYRNNSNLWYEDINTKVGYDLSERLTLEFSGGWHKDKYRLPGALYDTDINQKSRRDSVHNNDWASTDDMYALFKVSIEPTLDGEELGTFVWDISYRDRDTASFFDYGGGWITATNHEMDTFGATFKYNYDRELNGNDLSVIAGVDYYDNEDEITGSESNTDGITITKKNYALYALARYELIDNLTFGGGLRRERAEYTFDQAKTTARYIKENPDITSFSTELKYAYASGSNVYASAQKTFRFLATDEWYSTLTPAWGGGLETQLKQQKGMQYELGLKHNYDNMVLVKASPYLMDLENEIYYDPATWANKNHDDTRRLGVEAGLDIDLSELIDLSWLDRAKLSLGYTYQSARFKKGKYSGNYIPAVPKNQWSAGIDMDIFNYLNFALTGNYVGKRYMISDQKNNVERLDDYVLLNGKIAYKTDKLEAFVGINNILNEKYSEYGVTNSAGSAVTFYPSPEMNFICGVTGKY